MEGGAWKAAVHGVAEGRTRLSGFTFFICKSGFNSICLGAWWAAVHGVAESDTTERLPFHFSLSCIGEGNGNPLQYSCLENPREGAWRAAVYGVAQSRTRLK